MCTYGNCWEQKKNLTFKKKYTFLFSRNKQISVDCNGFFVDNYSYLTHFRINLWKCNVCILDLDDVLKIGSSSGTHHQIWGIFGLPFTKKKCQFFFAKYLGNSKLESTNPILFISWNLGIKYRNWICGIE